jgi:hypothetical protein
MGVAAMKETSAFRAVYADWKLVKTRQTIQIIFEIPLNDADAAYDVLGGMPQPAAERWFGIAAIKSAQTQTAPPKSAKSPIDWRDLQPAAQAGIRSADPVFWKYLEEEQHMSVSNADEAAASIRGICLVRSRAELGTNHKARVLWKQLDDQFYAWQRVCQ